MTSRSLRIGTRGSALAMWQAQWVAAGLGRLGHPCEIVTIKTTGDATSGPLTGMGGMGVFASEIQQALRAGDIDIAVHSLKDLPTVDVAGLTLAAVPRRESNLDVLVSNARTQLRDLPPAARVGTGSPRRQSQLRRLRPDLKVVEIRGNVDTRLAKVAAGEFDAIVLAQAGLTRLGRSNAITQVFSCDEMLPAVGQGALGLETRSDDRWSLDCVRPMENRASRAAVTAERALLAALRAGCLAPVGAAAQVSSDNALQLQAAVFSRDGTHRVAASGSTDDWRAAWELGERVAEEIKQAGGDALLEKLN